MAEPVDASDLGSDVLDIRVQVPLPTLAVVEVGISPSNGRETSYLWCCKLRQREEESGIFWNGRASVMGFCRCAQ